MACYCSRKSHLPQLPAATAQTMATQQTLATTQPPAPAQTDTHSPNGRKQQPPPAWTRQSTLKNVMFAARSVKKRTKGIMR